MLPHARSTACRSMGGYWTSARTILRTGNSREVRRERTGPDAMTMPPRAQPAETSEGGEKLVWADALARGMRCGAQGDRAGFAPASLLGPWWAPRRRSL